VIKIKKRYMTFLNIEYIECFQRTVNTAIVSFIFLSPESRF